MKVSWPFSRRRSPDEGTGRSGVDGGEAATAGMGGAATMAGRPRGATTTAGSGSELLSECSKPHVLYKKCTYASPWQNDEITKRTILEEDTDRLKHPPPRPPMDCQSYGNYLSYFWANNNITRDVLGIKQDSKDEWVRCHEDDLPYSKDIKSSIKYHRSVTLKGYHALVYSGDHDSVVPFLGTQAWVRSLNFSIVDDWRAWHVDGQSAGFTIAYSNNMIFATVKGGGHTAPEFQLERCLAMFRRWISNKPL